MYYISYLKGRRHHVSVGPAERLPEDGEAKMYEADELSNVRDIIVTERLTKRMK